MIKIAHVSDIHIRNFKYHDVYSAVFEQLYDKLRELKPDIIINTGDTAHTKLQLSPAYFDMTAKFFTNLSEIAPLHIIIGNHDLNLNNIANIDAITPIVEALKNDNIHFHKLSTIFEIGDVNFHVLSMVDPDSWNTDIDPNKVNVALYHGSVAGVKTDMGWIMEHGEIEYSVLEKFDYALLGDIHKTNQKLDYDGRCRYAGSLIQQNHGETNDKGFLFWEIENKEDFNVTHIPLTNPKPFVSVVLTDEGKLPENTSIPTGCRLRLISNTNHPAEIIKKAADVAKALYKPESISFLNKNVNASVGKNEKLLLKENLRDINVQENLIKEYLNDYNISDEVLEEVYKLNRKYNSVVSESEDVARNINWKLKHLEWDNLFNYGEGNKIDFNGLSGVVGIFGKNYSGKSSIVDAALYTIFNTTSKNERKTTNVINQAKQEGRGQVVIEVDGFEYTIDRKAQKYMKKLKGETTEEAKTTLDLRCFDAVSCQAERSLNELSRTDTDKYIRKLFGTIDDFMLTSLSSQLDSMSFIREGSTRRKEILAKFLDLEIFDEKFKLAKEESASLKGALKRYEGVDYATQLAEYEASLTVSKQEVETRESERSKLVNDKEQLVSSIKKLEEELINLDTASVDIEKAQTDFENSSKIVEDLSSKIEELNNNIRSKTEEVKSIDSSLSEYNLDDLKAKKDEIEKKQKELDKLYQEIVLTGREVQGLSTKIKLLEEVPCGTQFVSCKFIKDAYDSKMCLPLIEDALDQDKEEHTKLSKEIEEFDVNSVNTQISKYEAIVSKKSRLENEVLKHKLDLNFAKTSKEKNEKIKDQAEELMRLHAVNASNYEAIKEIHTNKKDLKNKLSIVEKSISDIDMDIRKLYIKVGSLEANIENANKLQKEFDQLRNEFAAYEYFMRCTHPNGISYDIIKKKLPIINDEIAKTLANIVDFEVFFEDDGSKLNILIKHPKFDPRPIEMGSGAEKTIASMAIRLALLQVSNLPKSDVLWLDEPATALDAEHLESFTKFLDLTKQYYSKVFLITHIDTLKDVCDTVITIEKENGYAKINV